jgi:hypothetical protein
LSSDQTSITRCCSRYGPLPVAPLHPLQLQSDRRLGEPTWSSTAKAISFVMGPTFFQKIDAWLSAPDLSIVCVSELTET